MLIWFGFFAGILAGIGLIAFLNPLSRRKREARFREAERRAADAERLAELGSLTSGLAHEIKNPLSSVVLNAQLVEEAMRDLEAPEDEKLPDELTYRLNIFEQLLLLFLRCCALLRLACTLRATVSRWNIS